MSSLTGLSPNNPIKYTGASVALNTVVTRNRAPTGADYRQPETGKLYPFNTFWLVGKNPTTGTQGDLWYLSKIVANVAYWSRLASGSTGDGPILTLTGDAGGAIDPDVNGNVNIIGGATTGLNFAGAGNTITGGINNWVNATANNYTPNVYGSSSSGAATYTVRVASTARVGNIVFFAFNMTWTAHTGTGNMRIGGFPNIFSLAFANYPTPLFTENVLMPAGFVDVYLNGVNGQQYANVVATRDNNTTISVALPNAGSVSAQGFYFSDT